jgi:hypothetical protein
MDTSPAKTLLLCQIMFIYKIPTKPLLLQKIEIWFAGALADAESFEGERRLSALAANAYEFYRQSPLSHGFAYAGTKKGKGYCGFGVYFRLLSMIAANTTTITMTAAAIAM